MARVAVDVVRPEAGQKQVTDSPVPSELANDRCTGLCRQQSLHLARSTLSFTMREFVNLSTFLL